MPNDRRIHISIKRDPALQATRVSLGKGKLVYVLVADKALKYRRGRSRIAYIGTTKKGLRRVAGSVARRADHILALSGVRSFAAWVVTCRPRQRVETWRVLERALLLKFRELFGEQPKCNVHGKRLRHRDEFEYFRQVRLETVIDQLS